MTEITGVPALGLPMEVSLSQMNRRQLGDAGPLSSAPRWADWVHRVRDRHDRTVFRHGPGKTRPRSLPCFTSSSIEGLA